MKNVLMALGLLVVIAYCGVSVISGIANDPKFRRQAEDIADRDRMVRLMRVRMSEKNYAEADRLRGEVHRLDLRIDARH